MSLMKKLVPAFLCLCFLFGVIYFLEPPKSINEAQWWQLLSIFIPFFAFLVSILGLYFRNLKSSLAFSLGIITLVILHLSNQLSLLTAVPVIIATIFIYRSVNHRALQTRLPVRIPKLSRLEKQ